MATYQRPQKQRRDRVLKEITRDEVQKDRKREERDQ
jgi:hypothetical protein